VQIFREVKSLATLDHPGNPGNVDSRAVSDSVLRARGRECRCGSRVLSVVMPSTESIDSRALIGCTLVRLAHFPAGRCRARADLRCTGVVRRTSTAQHAEPCSVRPRRSPRLLATSAPGLGPPHTASAPGPGSPLRTSAPGLGAPRPHLRRDWARPIRHLRRDWARPRLQVSFDTTRWARALPSRSMAHVFGSARSTA
jgi:hypothetical protein